VDALNEYFGLNASRSEWRTAIESLKSYWNIPNNYHGTIESNGGYYYKGGTFIDNIRDWLLY
jgi:hypothetical protein